MNMPQAVRIGDANSMGGIATGPGALSVLINGQPACLEFTPVSPHPCCGPGPCAKHCVAKTSLGSPSVLAEFQTINFVGNIDTCFDIRTQGSTDVIIGAM